MTITTDARTVVGVTHPLDPLSREEISRAVSILKDGQAAAESFRFISVELREPAKELLRAGSETVREADAVLIDRGAGNAFEAVVDLDAGIVTGWTQLASGVQPPFMPDEFNECERRAIHSVLNKGGLHS